MQGTREVTETYNVSLASFGLPCDLSGLVVPSCCDLEEIFTSIKDASHVTALVGRNSLDNVLARFDCLIWLLDLPYSQ
jgi:hypothetical protein